MNDEKRALAQRESAGVGFTYNKAGGYGVLVSPCNCCGGMLHINITRHGYVTFDCESFGDANRRPCKHARNVGDRAGEWNWKCFCPKERLDRACPNRTEKAASDRERIQGIIEAVIYTAAMSRKFVVLDLRENDYVDFEPAVVDAANMSFTIDGIANQRPCFVLVRRFYVEGENVSSRFVFFKKSFATTILASFGKVFLPFIARVARKAMPAKWIADRYELL